jgi:hypothetical protein
VPFAVFFGCCVAQFWFLKRIRDRLIDRHPQAFLEIEKSSFFPHQGLWKFTRRKRYEALRDEELNRRVRQFKQLYALAIVSWAAYGIALFTVPLE